MRLQGWRFWGLAALLLALNVTGLLWIHHDLTGGKRPHVRIMSVFPIDRADAVDRFTLRFDEPLAAPAAVGKPLAAAPFALQPQPDGKWQWAAVDQLEFVLSKPLPPGRQYMLRLAPDGENRIGHEIIGDKEFTFRTAPLELTGCSLVKTDLKKFIFELTFNQPVHPVDALEFMTVMDAEDRTAARLSVVALSREPGVKLVFQADRPKSDKANVWLSPKLAGVGAQLGLGAQIVRNLQIPVRLTLLKAETEERVTFSPNQMVRLVFSHDMNTKGALPEVTVTPAVKDLTVTRGGDEYGMVHKTDLALVGPFKCGVSYRATIRAGALSTDGETLAQDETVTFEFPDRQAAADFPVPRGVLSPQGSMKVDMDVVNLSAINVSAWKLHANNLAAYLKNHRQYYHRHKNGEEMLPEPAWDDMEGDEASQSDDTGRIILRKDIKLDLKRNEPKRLAVDLKSMVGANCGVYAMNVRGEGMDYWSNGRAVVAVTDLGLTVKRHRQGVLVWVNSLRTSRPVAGAKVSAITRNNQTLAYARTDAQGIAVLSAADSGPDGPVWLVTAELDGDLAYLLPQENTWETDELLGSRANVGGRPAPLNYDVMLYTERGAYRPGETIFLTGILRDAAGRIPSPFPLSVSIKRPDGKKVADLPIKPDTSGQGLFQAQFTPPEDGQTGPYTFTATLPGDESAQGALGTTEANVESFVPVRMEVKAAPTQDRYGPGEGPRANVSARYLFGQPAANLPVQVTGTYRPRTFQSAKYRDYVFTTIKQKKIDIPEVAASLNEEGKVTVDLPVATIKLPTSQPTSAPTTQATTKPASAPTTQPTTEPDDSSDDSVATNDSGEDEDSEDEDEGETPSTHAAGTAAAHAGGTPAKQVEAEVGFYEAELYATVNEEGGRSVSASFRTTLDTAGRYIGLRLPPGQILRTKTKIPVSWVQLTGKDEPAKPGEMKCVLSRIEWDWVVQEVNGQRTWHSAELATPVWTHTFALGELTGPAGQFEVLCPTSGQYRLEATDAATGNITVTEFYASEGEQGGLGELVRQPERLEIVLDKKQYTPGASAKVVVRSPFAGTMLLTLESDRVLDQRVIEMADKTAQLDLPLPESIRGGAFVTATVVAAVDPSRPKWLPHRAMGIARIATTHASHRLDLFIDSPAKVQPGQKVRVAVRTAQPLDPARPPMLHLWAVDEGILLTTAFATPSPMEHFFQPRKLEVETSDLFDQLMPDYQRPADVLSIGGGDSGGDEDMRLRSSPIAVRTRASAVIWRAAVPVGPDGIVKTELEMPKLTGQMRLMAVCVDHDRYGSAQRPVTVTSDLLVEAAWPRFSAPGDTFQVPIKVFNTTDKPIKADLSVDITGAVKVYPPDKPFSRDPKGSAAARPDSESTPSVRTELGNVSVPAGQSTVVWLTAEAMEVGQVKAVVTAKVENVPAISAECESLFTIRPAAPLEVKTRLIKLDAGKSLAIEPMKEFLPGASRTTLTVAGTPVINLMPALERLIDYPYGCVEQTTSRLYGMLYTPELLTLHGAAKGRADSVRELVDAGISRLWSMQTRDGGLGYWPGDHSVNLWGTTYAACFLAQAKRAGYAVDKRFSDELVKYLQEQMRAEKNDQMTENMRAEICDVLAAFGQPSESWMNRLGERPDKLDIGGRAHLAAAWLQMGRKDLAAKAIGADTMNLSVPITTGGRISSQVQQEATLLSVMLDLDATHVWAPMLAEKLNQARKDVGYWGTTHENAMCIAALAKFQARAQQSKSDFNGTVKSPDGKTTPFVHTKSTRLRLAGDGAGAEVASIGTGTIYIAQTTEGLLRDPGGFKPYDRNLEVRRTWMDRQGKAVDPSKLKVGDLVIVEIACNTTGDTRADNVAIVDELCGAMEVEHPRLMTSAKIGGSDTSADTADRTEFRDDRVILFVSAAKKTATYRYALRVISAGSYQLPPVQASCMYDPSFASIHGGGKVEVKR